MLLKNEKYKGDVLLGKTFTVDPISKRRLANMGEENQYYIRDHHEAIVSRKVWDKAEKIRLNMELIIVHIARLLMKL